MNTRLHARLVLVLSLAPALSAPLCAGEGVPKGLAAADWNGIRAAYERHRLEAYRVGDEYHARNPRQQMLARFDGRGFTLEPEGATWKWGLELEGVKGPAQVRTDGARTTYKWDSALDEWFVNDERGVDHGFTLHSPIRQGQDQIALQLKVRGGLRPRVHSDHLGADFLDPAGQSVIQYAGLKAWGADGKIVPARLEAVGEGLRLELDATGARYPITIDPIAQQAYLKASNTEANDQFGYSVAVSGDTVVVGAPSESSSTTGVNSTPDENAVASGAAYVFVRNAGLWTQQAYLKASNTGFADRFGYSVAISGDMLVVGAIGEDSSTTGVNSTPDDNAAESGAAYVFVRNSGVWSQQAYLKASNTVSNGQFGYSVATFGDTVVLGAPGDDSSTTGVNSTPNHDMPFAGAAYVFVHNSGVWTEQAYLKASNINYVDVFGWSVAISGDTVVVGKIGDDSGTTGVNSTPNEGAQASGAAYVFVRNSGVWTQEAYLKASNTGEADFFGWSVAISGNTLVVGAPQEDSSTKGINSTPNDDATDSGATYVFVRNSGVWTQQAYLKASNPGAVDYFGASVGISGDTAVVGSYMESSSTTGVNGQPNEGANNSGAAYVFMRNAGNWTQQAFLKPSNTGAFDLFGWSVAISGDTVVAGAYDEDSAATGINGSQASNSASSAGAAYIFTMAAASCPFTAQLTLTPNQLTPPDHRLVEVTATIQVAPCVAGAQVKLLSIKSSDKDSGLGQGDLPKDIQQATYGTNDRKFLLRAERSNMSPNIITNRKRTYTITYQVKDASSNTRNVTGTVTVP